MSRLKLLPTLFWFSLLVPAVRAGNLLPIKNDFGAKQAVPKSAEASLELPTKVRIGDAIKGRFIIKNSGNEVFGISTGGDYRGSGIPLRLKVRVTDAKGNVLPDMSQGLPCFGGLRGGGNIEPGKSVEIEFPLQGYVTFRKAGIYNVEACHDLGWIVDNAKPHPVAKTKIEIVLPTPEEAASLVRELCTGSDENNNWRLDKLQHPLFLPSLVEEADHGRAAAVIGIGNIPSTEALEALLKLLKHSSTEVVKTAAQELTRRLPSLVDSSKPAFEGGFDRTSRDALLKTWEPRFHAPLMEAALKLLQSPDKDIVELGASFIHAQGGNEHAQSLLEATQRALDVYVEPRAGKDANVLDPPAPLRGLIRAIDALRKRGWRLDVDSGGGTAVILSQFRQIADPKMPRPKDVRWKQSVIAFMESNPPTFRENAVRAIPLPLTDEFEKPLLMALDDADWGVILVACEIAGKSGRKVFIPALTQIVETVHESFVQSAAHNAAIALGARTELWQAWCEVITDKERMYDALSHLLRGTIDLPPSSSGGGNSNFTRDQRFVIRDAWRAFLAKHHDRLANGGRIPMDDLSITPLLTGANFQPDQPAAEIFLKDGSKWPPRAAAKK